MLSDREARRLAGEFVAAMRDAYGGPGSPPRRAGRPWTADEPTPAVVDAALAALATVRAVFSGECPDRAVARARYAQASFVQEIQTCREARREEAAWIDCHDDWVAKARGMRDIDDLLACNRAGR